MAEATTYFFEYKEIAEALLKQQGIHEGLWGISINFGLAAANIPGPLGTGLLPAAIVPVMKIGIQRFDKPNALTVDAAEINPLSAASSKAISTTPKSRRRRKTKTETAESP